MKKFFEYFENLWVAVTFAEAGEYELIEKEGHLHEEETAYAHAS